MSLLTLNPSPFNTTHMYVALAFVESVLEEEGYGLPTHHNGLGEMNKEEIKVMFHDYLRQSRLEVLCDKA